MATKVEDKKDLLDKVEDEIKKIKCENEIDAATKEKEKEKETKKTSLEEKRNEFRKYLQTTGAIDKLTATLLKLFQTSPRPEDAIKFIREELFEDGIENDERFQALIKELESLKIERDILQKKLNVATAGPQKSDSEMALKLQLAFDDLKGDDNCKSLLKKYLTEEVYEELEDEKTEFKGNLLDVCQAGFEYKETEVGIFACDATAYMAYKNLFDPLIEDLHEPFKKTEKHPKCDWGTSEDLVDLDPTGHFVKAIRIDCFKSLEKTPFIPIDIQENMELISTRISGFLTKLSGELKGTFYDLEKFNTEQAELKDELKARKLTFENTDETLEAAKTYKFWPIARGIYVSNDKKFVVWVNAEEHLQVISQEEGGNLASVYDRMVKFFDQVSSKSDLKFATDNRYGFVNFNPMNIGNTLRASVTIKLEKLILPENEEKFEALLTTHPIKLEGTLKKKLKPKEETDDKDKDAKDKDGKPIAKDDKAKSKDEPKDSKSETDIKPKDEKTKDVKFKDLEDQKKKDEAEKSKDGDEEKEKEEEEEEKKEPQTEFTFVSDHLLGISEIDAMKEFQKGIQEMILMEKCLR